MGSGHHEIRNVYNTHSYTRTQIENGERNPCNNITQADTHTKKNQMSSRKPKIMYNNNNMSSYAFSSTHIRHTIYRTIYYTIIYLLFILMA